jgi:uncharacterized protein YbjT (DUF2867 family)
MTELLVLGATGKTGRRVVTALTAAGHTVRAAARTPGPAAPGVTPVVFDWDDRSTHDAALAGAGGVYVIPPALRLDHPPLIAAFLDRAKAAGVERAVLLSARGADADPSAPLALAEAAVRDSGLAWTVLRPTWFAQNFTEGAFRPDGALVAPAAGGAVPFIDAQDIAAVAAAALTGDGHAGQTYELSSDRALTWAQAAAVLAEHAGRPIGYVDADPAEWQRGAEAAGIPADYAALFGILFGVIRAGHEAPVSDGVERALGRPPTSFEAWAAREAGALRAPVPAPA